MELDSIPLDVDPTAGQTEDPPAAPGSGLVTPLEPESHGLDLAFGRVGSAHIRVVAEQLTILLTLVEVSEQCPFRAQRPHPSNTLCETDPIAVFGDNVAIDPAQTELNTDLPASFAIVGSHGRRRSRQNAAPNHQTAEHDSPYQVRSLPTYLVTSKPCRSPVSGIMST